MKTNSSSCFSTLILAVAFAALLRFVFPSAWRVIEVLFTGTLFTAGILFLVLLMVIIYFTYKNLKTNKAKQEAGKYARVTRIENLYRAVTSRLQEDLTLNQVTAEELLQSEILVTERLRQIKDDLIRLKDFTSPKNEKSIIQGLREYQNQLKETADESVKELARQNIRMLEEKIERLRDAREEIREKEAIADLVQNHLLNVEEDLKFGRPVRRLLPPEIYLRFGLTPPSDQQTLPPLIEKSSASKE